MKESTKNLLLNMVSLIDRVRGIIEQSDNVDIQCQFMVTDTLAKMKSYPEEARRYIELEEVQVTPPSLPPTNDPLLMQLDQLYNLMHRDGHGDWTFKQFRPFGARMFLCSHRPDGYASVMGELDVNFPMMEWIAAIHNSYPQLRAEFDRLYKLESKEKAVSAHARLIEEANKIHYGTVKWFNNAKGFGFIKPDDSAEDIYAHFSNIISPGFKTLKEGQRVSFRIEPIRSGRVPSGNQATDIKPV